MKKVVITGAAGLVGQNLVARLKDRPDIGLVGIDKHHANVSIFRRIHPEVEIIEADLADAGNWREALIGCDTLILCHAQIGGIDAEEFVRNNITSTELALKAAKAAHVGYIIHISSSVINSQAVDDYTESKKQQEAMVAAAGIPHVILRPTLMFGWYDRKHLGWLRRFMGRSPIFPIPGTGQFIRQPLYVGDFAAIILSCLADRRVGSFDISGLERIAYVDLIKDLRDVVGARTRLIHIPYRLFWWLLRLYAVFDRSPPFTTRQLEALVIPEEFSVIDWPRIFGVQSTPLHQALVETYRDDDHADIVLEF